jgi:hypothetical protein
MKFANTIMDNEYRVKNGITPHWGQLEVMRKLLAKGESGTFWASDFDIEGCEMVGLSYLPSVIKPTGATKEVEIIVEKWIGWNNETNEVEFQDVPMKVTAKQWELLDYDKLKRAYDLLVELMSL